MFLQAVSNHPVHILNKNHEVSPSSFIPFCSFGGNMNRVGTKISIFSIPVCKIFEPKNHNDQVCFEADLEKLKNDKIDNFLNSLQIGLVLLIDHNEDRQMYFPTESESEEKEEIFTYNRDNPALIYFDTIS